MKSTTAVLAALTLASAAAAGAVKRSVSDYKSAAAWAEKYSSETDIELTFFCEQNATNPSEVVMFWGTEGFGAVTELVFVNEATNEFQILALDKTGGGNGNSNITSGFSGSVSVACLA
jgi:hypothetical protein